MRDLAEKKNDPLLQKFNQKILGVHCKNAVKSSLREILSSQVVQQRIQSLGFSTETKELERFFEQVWLERGQTQIRDVRGRD